MAIEQIAENYLNKVLFKIHLDKIGKKLEDNSRVKNICITINENQNQTLEKVVFYEPKLSF